MDTIDTNFTFWKDNIEKATFWEKHISNFVKELLGSASMKKTA